MKKKILITVHSLEIGGIERSLVGLLDVIDYTRYDVDVLLFSRKGELLPFVSDQCTILPEIPQCATLLQPIKAVLLQGHILLGAARLAARRYVSRHYRNPDGDPQFADGVIFALLQKYWDYSIRFMPSLSGEYDAAISFMWPHHFVAQKVRAKNKIAWIHTDYTVAVLDRQKDADVWARFDRIAAVSDECGAAFLQVYPQFQDRLTTIENILPQAFVRRSAEEFEPQEMQNAGYRLLSVGRLCYPKAYDRAVRVSRILKDRGLPFCWYIVGYGLDEEKLRAQIAELDVADCFVLLGKKSNPYPYIRGCDLFLQPSRYEGKAVTVREAQMLGRPVLITDFKTARSQVRDGFDAVIVPQDETAIADAIEALLNDAQRRDALSANTRTVDYSNASEVEKIYRMVEG